MANAWLFQDHKQKQKLGPKCPWSVGWLNPDGKRRSKKLGSKSMADKFRQKIEGQLAAGVYEDPKRQSWEEFRKRYEGSVKARKSAGTLECVRASLDKFEEIIKPARLASITTTTVEEFVEKRAGQRGRREGDIVSPATVNKDLRNLKAAMRKAAEWDLIIRVPKFEMLREPEKLPPYVTPEHFALIYDHCSAAGRPLDLPYSPELFWQALLTFCFMTGWRISEPIKLRRHDVDLDECVAITRHGDNKGKRDSRTPLHPVVVDHLRQIPAFDEYLFPWPHNRRQLYTEFYAIQKAASIHLPCHESHEHTETCHLYGFHGFRYAFATLNDGRLSGHVLQSLMRHRSPATTRRYVDIAQQYNQAVADLHVPERLTATG
jgi:integrase